jgi:2-methylcitrate dehydratase PrpD
MSEATSLSAVVSDWVRDVRFDDLPADVVESTRLRVLDVVGLTLAGRGTAFGRAVCRSTLELHEGGPARVLGLDRKVGVTGAAFANGSLSQALEYDDTHNESIVHMSGPAVAAALAITGRQAVSGVELIRAVAIGNEISCRVGSVTPGQFHKRGFHPTGLFAVFGTTWLAAALHGLDRGQMVSAAGIAGSFAAGLLQCWVDGTASKFLHPGWAAQSGISAASLAGQGATGPAEIFEGRFGLFASHLQSADIQPNWDRITGDLGSRWDSRQASFKPFPVAHVIHPYIDAVLRLRAAHGIDPDRIARVLCPVAAYQVGIVCEPLDEKRRPRSDSHGRVSLQYTLAEALVKGRIGKDAYASASLADPRILGLADRIEYRIDDGFPGPERFKAEVVIEMNDGARFETIEENNRGSAANPMALDDLIAKFDENVSEVLTPAEAKRLRTAILGLETAESAATIVDMTVPGHG